MTSRSKLTLSTWCQPTPHGHEGRIAEKLAHLRKLDEEAGKG
jgi:putative ATPase